jgi:hypothetical protein
MTKAKMIEELKAQYPTLRIGDEESGYTDLSAEDYEETIELWANNLLTAKAEALAAENAKKAAEAKLAALGLTPDDLKALGL